MKKLLFILLCLMVAFSVVGCNKNYGSYYDDYLKEKSDGYDLNGKFVFLNGRTSATLYNLERNRILELEACTLRYEEFIVFDFNGETIKNDKNLILYKGGLNEEYYCLKQDSTKTEGWFIDGVFYKSENGKKRRQEASRFAYNEYCRPKEANLNNILINFPFEWIDYKEYNECEGGYYISFTLKGAEYREKFRDSFISELYQGMDEIEHRIYFSTDATLTGMEIFIKYNSGGAKAEAKIKAVITEENIAPPSINTDEFK